MTVTVIESDLVPSNTLVAVIVAVPTPTAVNVAAPGPVFDTVATDVSLELHVTDGSAPPAAVTVAVNEAVSPVMRAWFAWSIETPVTAGAFTVTVMVEAFEGSTVLFAVTFAVPAFTPVILPVLSTVRILVSLELHVTVCGAVVGLTVTLSVAVAPT